MQLQTAIRSPFSFLFSRLSKPSSFRPSSYVTCSSSKPFWCLHETGSNKSIFLLYWGDQNWTKHSGCSLHKHRIVGKDKFSRSASCNLCNTAQDAAYLCFFLAAALLTHIQLAVHHDLQILFWGAAGPQPVLVWAVTLYRTQGFAFTLVKLHGVLVSFLPVPSNFIPVLTNLAWLPRALKDGTVFSRWHWPTPSTLLHTSHPIPRTSVQTWWLNDLMSSSNFHLYPYVFQLLQKCPLSSTLVVP